MHVTVYDNGGATFDRYTCIFPDGRGLILGTHGNTPNGVCQHVERWKPIGRVVELTDLPKPVYEAIEAEWKDWYF